MAHESTKAVVVATIVNAILTVLKFAAGLATHSPSMMNEATHSLMDTANQTLLYFGLVAGSKPADKDYAFGHGQNATYGIFGAPSAFSR